MGIKDKWSEGVERTRQQAAAAEVARAEAFKESARAPAQAAWDAGLACYVLTLRFEFTKVLDAEASAVTSEVIGVGWKLQSTAMTFIERTGMNNVSCMFTFVR